MTKVIRGIERPSGRTIEIEQEDFGGGGSQVTDRAQYDIALHELPHDVLTKMPFVFNYGTELLDLSDPLNPTPFESGTYSFTVTVSISEIFSEEISWLMNLILDENDFGAEVNYKTTTSGGDSGSATISFPFYVPVGSPCFVRVRHTDAANAAEMVGHVYVQRFS